MVIVAGGGGYVRDSWRVLNQLVDKAGCRAYIQPDG
jgi:hypothetical protein